MSDLYLTLHRRLDEVARWTHLDTQTLIDARDAKGLGREAVARQLGTSAKTFERYEKEGRVPTYLVERLAGLLDLNIERVPARTITVEDDPEISDLRALVVRIEDAAQSIAAESERIADLLAAQATFPAQSVPK